MPFVVANSKGQSSAKVALSDATVDTSAKAPSSSAIQVHPPSRPPENQSGAYFYMEGSQVVYRQFFPSFEWIEEVLDGSKTGQKTWGAKSILKAPKPASTYASASDIPDWDTCERSGHLGAWMFSKNVEYTVIGAVDPEKPLEGKNKTKTTYRSFTDRFTKFRMIARSIGANTSTPEVTLPQGYKVTVIPHFRITDSSETPAKISDVFSDPLEIAIPPGGSISNEIDPSDIKGLDDYIPAATNTEVLLTLLPVEFKNVRDVANAQDDVDISPKQNATDTSINSVAWIDNHSSGTNDAPRMPQLRLSIPGLSSDMRIKAKLEVDYTRPYAGHQSEDRVRVPSNGNFREVTGSAWDIYNDADWTTAVGQGFFGGDATLTYQLTKADGTVVMQNQTILFRIAGQNPEDARCKDYIVSQSGTAWFAYALAKHESNLYGGEATYYPFTPVSPNNAKYNQFRALGGGQSGTRVAGREGIPLIERAEDSGPGGIGMFQVTGSATDETAIIPRAQLWNWQANVNGALAIIQHAAKSGLATRYFNDLQNDPAPYPAAYQENPPPTIRFGNTDFSSSDAIWITAYNGWGGQISPYPVRGRYKFNPSLPPGLNIAPEAQTKRWFWNAPLNPDEFYIRKVERLLEADPNTD
jgi:hypothetical protein